jgi:MOSC domain-containing protein YiiM
MMDVARGLSMASPVHRGEVVQINASNGGVPKLAVDSATVTVDGVVGDVQADTKHHGRPFQALSLWSADVLDTLAAQGHPIGPGCAGENVTLRGIDWTSLCPGTTLRIGSVVAELSYPAVPCAKQTRWFTDGDFNRISHERNPQWVRWYAWVREPGVITTGDAATTA